MLVTVVRAGYGIIVVDQGFVYVGEFEVDDKFCHLTRAKNIRVWGTKRGLGQLSLEGPTQTTILDAIADVHIPIGRVLHVIDTERTKWPA